MSEQTPQPFLDLLHSWITTSVVSEEEKLTKLYKAALASYGEDHPTLEALLQVMLTRFKEVDKDLWKIGAASSRAALRSSAWSRPDVSVEDLKKQLSNERSSQVVADCLRRPDLDEETKEQLCTPLKGPLAKLLLELGPSLVSHKKYVEAMQMLSTRTKFKSLKVDVQENVLNALQTNANYRKAIVDKALETEDIHPVIGLVIAGTSPYDTFDSHTLSNFMKVVVDEKTRNVVIASGLGEYHKSRQAAKALFENTRVTREIVDAVLDNFHNHVSPNRSSRWRLVMQEIQSGAQQADKELIFQQENEFVYSKIRAIAAARNSPELAQVLENCESYVLRETELEKVLFKHDLLDDKVIEIISQKTGKSYVDICVKIVSLLLTSSKFDSIKPYMCRDAATYKEFLERALLSVDQFNHYRARALVIFPQSTTDEKFVELAEIAIEQLTAAQLTSSSLMGYMVSALVTNHRFPARLAEGLPWSMVATALSSTSRSAVLDGMAQALDSDDESVAQLVGVINMAAKTPNVSFGHVLLSAQVALY